MQDTGNPKKKISWGETTTLAGEWLLPKNCLKKVTTIFKLDAIACKRETPIVRLVQRVQKTISRSKKSNSNLKLKKVKKL